MLDDVLTPRVSWKESLSRHGDGYYTLCDERTGGVPVRLFLTAQLLEDLEESVYTQIITATRFPGVKLVVITPDCHSGYGVPIGCALVTDAEQGAIALGPVGFDIGCFSPSTLVPTVDGGVHRIDDLAARGGEVWIYAMKPTLTMGIAKATPRLTRRGASLVCVRLDNGREVECTPDHEFMLADGSYRRAEALSPGVQVMPFEPRGARGNRMMIGPSPQKRAVVEVTAVAGRHDVFCLTVPELGNFALDAGVFVHNCGMVSLSSSVPADAATDERRLAFNRAVMQRVSTGAGEVGGERLRRLGPRDFEALIRGGADAYVEMFGDRMDRSRAERNCIPVDDAWELPRSRADRGMAQIGSLGGGNHFIELQRSEQNGMLFVQIHTGSRGFGHGLASHYFQVAKDEQPQLITDMDSAWFAADSPQRSAYLAAVAAGGNYAIVNRLSIAEEVSSAFKSVFGRQLELVYEISHNLVQREWHPDFGWVNIHRKGATRAFPAGHPQLVGTPWADTGHPVLIPGSNRDWSYILRPADSAKSAFTVNHGAGRRLSRSAAMRRLDQDRVDADYAAAGIVVNIDRRVPLDESGAAYKSSADVIAAIEAANLATVEHRLWPLASVKAPQEHTPRGAQRPRGGTRSRRGGARH